MSIHFAEVDGRPAFFDTAIHGAAIPADAVEIAPARHAELLDAQAAGKEIYAGKEGKPRFRQPHVDADQRRTNLAQLVRTEAARRIDQVSPIWRQMNDLRAPKASKAAKARFAAIDAIRAASGIIEAQLADTPAAALESFDPKNRPEWPAEPA